MEAGEERFAVEWMEEDDTVWYGDGFSRPLFALSSLWLGVLCALLWILH